MSAAELAAESCLTAGFALMPGARDLQGRPVLFVPLDGKGGQFAPAAFGPVLHYLWQRIA